ncbi:MAG: zinc ribbon domain-containing protein [Armatimonadetes bacterium]|nr:zinc ribbon domain-containing protein [Armatimonadota bacterium]
MVTLEEFDRAHKIIGVENPLKSRSTRTLPFTGLLVCTHCGGQIAASVKTKPSGRTYTYYHCQGRCPRKRHGTREDVLEQKISDLLAEVAMRPEFYVWAIEEIKASSEKERGKLKAVYDQRLRALQGIDQQLDALIGMRMRDLLDDEEYRTRREKLAMERAKLHEAVKEVELGAEEVEGVEVAIPLPDLDLATAAPAQAILSTLSPWKNPTIRSQTSQSTIR